MSNLVNHQRNATIIRWHLITSRMANITKKQDKSREAEEREEEEEGCKEEGRKKGKKEGRNKFVSGVDSEEKFKYLIICKMLLPLWKKVWSKS